MRIPKSWVGQVVEILWRDPFETRLDRHSEGEFPKGWDPLGYQKEVGRVIDVTNGVVTLQFSRGWDADCVRDETSTVTKTLSWVVEDLIEEAWLYPDECKKSLKEPKDGQT